MLKPLWDILDAAWGGDGAEEDQEEEDVTIDPLVDPDDTSDTPLAIEDGDTLEKDIENDLLGSDLGEESEFECVMDDGYCCVTPLKIAAVSSSPVASPIPIQSTNEFAEMSCPAASSSADSREQQILQRMEAIRTGCLNQHAVFQPSYNGLVLGVLSCSSGSKYFGIATFNTQGF